MDTMEVSMQYNFYCFYVIRIFTNNYYDGDILETSFNYLLLNPSLYFWWLSRIIWTKEGIKMCNWKQRWKGKNENDAGRTILKFSEIIVVKIMYS
jgi:hypothetical protein